MLLRPDDGSSRPLLPCRYNRTQAAIAVRAGASSPPRGAEPAGFLDRKMWDRKMCSALASGHIVAIDLPAPKNDNSRPIHHRGRFALLLCLSDQQHRTHIPARAGIFLGMLLQIRASVFVKDLLFVGRFWQQFDSHGVLPLGQVAGHNEHAQPMVCAITIKARPHLGRPAIDRNSQLTTVGAQQVIEPYVRAAKANCQRVAGLAGSPEAGQPVAESLRQWLVGGQ